MNLFCQGKTISFPLQKLFLVIWLILVTNHDNIEPHAFSSFHGRDFKCQFLQMKCCRCAVEFFFDSHFLLPKLSSPRKAFLKGTGYAFSKSVFNLHWFAGYVVFLCHTQRNLAQMLTNIGSWTLLRNKFRQKLTPQKGFWVVGYMVHGCSLCPKVEVWIEHTRWNMPEFRNQNSSCFPLALSSSSCCGSGSFLLGQLVCLKQCSATVPLVCVSLRRFFTPYNLFKGNVCRYSMLGNERSVGASAMRAASSASAS